MLPAPKRAAAAAKTWLLAQIEKKRAAPAAPSFSRLTRVGMGHNYGGGSRALRRPVGQCRPGVTPGYHVEDGAAALILAAAEPTGETMLLSQVVNRVASTRRSGEIYPCS